MNVFAYKISKSGQYSHNNYENFLDEILHQCLSN